MRETLLKINALFSEARAWQALALESVELPIIDAHKATALKFAHDVLKLEMLATLLRAEDRVAFYNQLDQAAKEYEPAKLSSVWAKLRQINAKYAVGNADCVVSAQDAQTISSMITIFGYYPNDNPLDALRAMLAIDQRCKLQFNATSFAELFKVAAANDNSAARASDIAQLSPFRPSLRLGMATAETAGLPADILRGYVATIDRHRPNLTVKGPAFVPIRFVAYSGQQAR